MFTAQNLFDLQEFPFADIFTDTEYVWQALDILGEYIGYHTDSTLFTDLPANGIPLTEHLILHDGKVLSGKGYDISFSDATKGALSVRMGEKELPGASVIMAGVTLMGPRICLGQGVLLESGALVKEPVIIGDCSEIRQGAYLRGNCLVGKRCVVGHTTEIKNSIFLNDAKAGHFAYLGDSILGTDANLGAGTKMANLRFLPGNVRLKTEGGLLDTGRRKFGAILGDRVQTGCNSVTNPGTIIGPDSVILPNTTAKAGYHSAKSVIR